LYLPRAKKAKKTTEGLFEIDQELLDQTVQLDQELNFVFGSHLSKYNKKTKYVALLEIKEYKENEKDKEKTNEIAVFVEKYACDGGNSKVKLTDNGENFLMYLLSVNRNLLADCSYWMVKYAKKKTVDELSIEMAVRNHYTAAEGLCGAICKKLSEVADLVDEANKAARDEKEKSDNKSDKKDKKSSDKKDKKSDDKKADSKKSDSKKSDNKKSDKKDKKKDESESDKDSSSSSGSDTDEE